MNPKFDDITLSAYVDGELDAQSMQAVEAFIENDAEARSYVLNAMKINARLRGAMNNVLHEKIPEHLIDTIITRPEAKAWQSGLSQPMLRLAASVVLILFGFAAGWLIPANPGAPAFTLPTPFPAGYNRVVQEAMEFNLSGTPRQWQSPENEAVVVVTPVKTYRDQNGQYLREFRMEVSTPTQTRQVNGLALRQNGEWQTKAVYFQ